MWIDSHCHLDAPDFDADRDEVVAQATRAGLRRSSTCRATSIISRLRRRRASGNACLTGYGIHPMWVSGPLGRSRREDLAVLRDWVEREKPDLIGEIGLDFFIPDFDAPEQEWFLPSN